MKMRQENENNRRNPYSVAPLSGEEAERFLEFDAQVPTEADIENLREAKDFYIEHCETQKRK